MFREVFRVVFRVVLQVSGLGMRVKEPGERGGAALQAGVPRLDPVSVSGSVSGSIRLRCLDDRDCCRLLHRGQRERV